MKKIVSGITVLFAVLFFASCLKSKDPGCPYVDRNIYAADSIVAQLQTHLDTSNIQVTGKDTSGVFYKVVTPGTVGGDTADVCSVVTVYYKGSLLNGTEFDKTSAGAPASFRLGDLIPGFQKGMKYIGTGGKIEFYIPYPLGYGSQEIKNQATGAVVIPANSHLKFEVELLEVRN